MNPASAPSSAHCRSVRVSRVAAHIQMNAAAPAIDGACVMLGSLTMYQSMKEPMTTKAVAMAASPRGK